MSVESESTSVSTIQQWIVDNSGSGLTFLSVFNNKSTVFAGEQGNFNIIAFGQNSNELTLLVVNHWNAHAWSVSVSNGVTWTWVQLHK